MNVSEYREKLLENTKPKVIEGDGFTVKIHFPFAIRYIAHGKTLTLGIELKQREGSWWIFGNYLAVYVQVPICWDNEDEPMSTAEADRILARLKGVLDKHEKKRYELVFFDRLVSETRFDFRMGR